MITNVFVMFTSLGDVLTDHTGLTCTVKTPKRKMMRSVYPCLTAARVEVWPCSLLVACLATTRTMGTP